MWGFIDLGARGQRAVGFKPESVEVLGFWDVAHWGLGFGVCGVRGFLLTTFMS